MHLEALMPKYNGRGDKFTQLMDDMTHISCADKEEETLLQKRDAFAKLLSKYSLEPHLVEILVASFVYNWSYKDIAEEYGFTMREDVHRLYKLALKQLKERGIK